MAEIVMPRLSDTMEEGTILRWLKRDGEHVGRGEELVEIETDKAAMVYESDEEGVLEIAAAEGDTLPVGATIAHVASGASSTASTSGAAGETAPDGGPRPAQPDDAGPIKPDVAAPIQTDVAAPIQTDAAGAIRADAAARAQPETAPPEIPQPTPQPGVAASVGASVGSAAAPSTTERVKASPVARRIAREREVDLHAMTGSGPGGRIVKADVEAATGATTHAPTTDLPSSSTAAAAGASAARSSEPQPTLAERVATAKGETTVVELTRTQQAIARRMAESKATIPDFSLTADIDMEPCVALRAELKRLSPEQAPTYNDMVVKACALALREHTHANGSYRDGQLQLHSRVNVGVAVATDDALIVPTVFDADVKALGEIARETRALAERVRSGAITPPELGGGTFTVSNLGMYGVASFAAIINPPQAAILSVGLLAPRAVVHEGQVVARQMMSVTLVCDHRILYGADAARFLARIRELLQEPTALTL
jgi:pyruvate dehydrogenase E2 component (dihydrolipoamide acetyltransferase)